MYIKKTLQELTLKDNFMFGAVMSEEANCKRLLELILGFTIARIEVSKERSITYHPEYKGVRLDVYAADENNTRYNVEMQAAAETSLGKRSRYYHSQIDMELLQSGSSYSDLPDSYVIFICDFDPFGERKYRYSFIPSCQECPTARLKDGSCTIFLNTRGENPDEIPRELRSFLEYVSADLEASAKDFGDAYVKSLQRSVTLVKQSREMEQRYMILQEMLSTERSEGYAEGELKGELKGQRKKQAANILTLLEHKGTVSETLRSKITEETDLGVLERWFELAIETDSVEQFAREIQ